MKNFIILKWYKYLKFFDPSRNEKGTSALQLQTFGTIKLHITKKIVIEIMCSATFHKLCCWEQ